MKFIALALVLAIAVAASAFPQFNTKKVIGIVQKDEVRDEAGQFTLRYVSEDGTMVSEVGKLVPNLEGDDQVLVKEGSYTFTAPEGQTYTVNYVADKDGFKATGAHIPVV